MPAQTRPASDGETAANAGTVSSENPSVTNTPPSKYRKYRARRASRSSLMRRHITERPKWGVVNRPLYRTNPTDRLIAGSRASRLNNPARDVCSPIGRALGGGGANAPSS